MRAIYLASPGGVEGLVLSDLPVPQIKDHEVLLQVKAISINPVDTKVRKNSYILETVLAIKPDEHPVILGWDISGIISSTGAAVKDFRPGDEVFGTVNFPGHGKAYAEYVAVPQAHLALKPSNVTHEEAAAGTLAALTAWQALVGYGEIEPGKKVLIHSAAGGVGHYAVQIAKHLGAYVVGTSSSGNRDFVLKLGADRHIDYRNERFEDLVNDMDIVVDSVEEDGHLERSLKTVVKGGTLISLNRFFDKHLDIARKAKQKEVFAHRLEITSNGDDMKSIARIMADGKLKSYIFKSYPLAEVAAAHTALENGQVHGKIVLTLPDDE